MASVIENILIWSEVWALLIPLYFIITLKKLPGYTRPVRYYVIAALLLNIAANTIANQRSLGLHLRWHNNIAIYNFHSIIRLLLFSWFFISLKQPYLTRIKVIIPILFLAFAIVNFTFFESFFNKKISSIVHSLEAICLLFYCLQYYLYLLREELYSFKKLPSFWIVTGLSLFVVSSFPIYLYYDVAVARDTIFARSIWQVQEAAFIIFCILTSIGLYVSKQ